VKPLAGGALAADALTAAWACGKAGNGMEEIEGSSWVTANIQQGACQKKSPWFTGFS